MPKLASAMRPLAVARAAAALRSLRQAAWGRQVAGFQVRGPGRLTGLGEDHRGYRGFVRMGVLDRVKWGCGGADHGVGLVGWAGRGHRWGMWVSGWQRLVVLSV